MAKDFLVYSEAANYERELESNSVLDWEPVQYANTAETFENFGSSQRRSIALCGPGQSSKESITVGAIGEPTSPIFNSKCSA